MSVPFFFHIYLFTCTASLKFGHTSFFNVKLCPLQLRREKQHLESELERAERESATYVTEVREVSL